MSSIAHSIMETTGILPEPGTDKRKFTMHTRSKSIHSETLFSDGH